MRDEQHIAVLEKPFQFKKGRVAFKKCIKYHYNLLQDATIMTLIHLYSIISEVVDFFKVHISMQDMHPCKNLRGHESEVDESKSFHQKWYCRE